MADKNTNAETITSNEFFVAADNADTALDKIDFVCSALSSMMEDTGYSNAVANGLVNVLAEASMDARRFVNLVYAELRQQRKAGDFGDFLPDTPKSL